MARGRARPSNPVQLDAAIAFGPWLTYAVREVGRGRWPLWNPYAYCGSPFLANPQAGILSPFTLPAYVLPLSAALAAAAWLKLAIAGWGMYAFLRATGAGALGGLCGGASYQWCGWLAVWLRFPQAGVAAWLPLLLWLAEKLVRAPGARPVGLLALATGASALAGHPETSFHVLLLAGAYGLARAGPAPGRALAALAAAFALGGALAAVQYLPFLDYLSRSAVLELRTASAAGVLPARAFLEAFVPAYHGSPLGPPVWHPLGINPNETAVAAGGLAWILAPLAFLPAFSRRAAARGRIPVAWFLAGAAVAGALIACRNPVVTPVVTHVPPFSMTLNARTLLWTSFCLSGLAGFGFDALVRGVRGALNAAAASAAAVAVVIAAAIALDAGRLAAAGAFLPAVGRAGAVLGLLGAGVLLVGVAARSPAWRRPAVVLVLLLHLFPAVRDAASANRVSPRALWYPELPALAFARRAAGGGRVILPLPNLGTAYRIRDVSGYDAIAPAGIRRLLAGGEAPPAYGPGPVLFQGSASSPILDRLGVRLLVKPPDVAGLGPGWTCAYRGPDATVWRHAGALPRARLEGSGPPPVFASDEPARVVLRVKAAGRTRLVLMDTWDPGWKAFLDGRRVRVALAEQAFRAVEVEAGAHTVEFRYDPLPFKAGLWLAAAALGLVAWLVRKER